MRAARADNVDTAAALGAAGTTAAAALVATSGQLGWPYVVQASLVHALFVAWLLSTARGPLPVSFGLANAITSVRVTLMALVAGLVGRTDPPVSLVWSAVGAAGLASLLDGMDGWVARRLKLSSAFGARFDMETDAALIAVLAVLVWQEEKAGVWVLGCGAMRYGFVAAGWRWPWLAGPLPPTFRGRLVAAAQFVGLATALAPIVPRGSSELVAAATLALLVWSFALDVARLRRGRISASR
jgi:phosphatidylglycerophosphate synthase